MNSTNREKLSNRLTNRNDYNINIQCPSMNINSQIHPQYQLRKKQINESRWDLHSTKHQSQNQFDNDMRKPIFTPSQSIQFSGQTRTTKKNDILNKRLESFQPIFNSYYYPIYKSNKIDYNNKPKSTR
jgi:hypothetical protein